MNLNENILRVKEVMGLISESFEDESGSEVFPKGNFSYHITPDVFLNQIQQLGLVPKSESKISTHPERIYLFMNPEMDKEMTNVLWNATKKETRDNINDYYVLQVDLTQLPNHKFYLDRESSFSYVAIYTLQPIPSSAIKVIKKIPTSDLKQDPSPEEQNAIDDEFEKVMSQFRDTDVNENILRVKEVMGLISENENRWFLRRLAEIDRYVDLALSKVPIGGHNYHDYVEEIAWHVADEYENKNNPGIELILDYIRDNYWKKIEDHYLKSNDLSL